MVDFAGWSMPVQYESIIAEHVATRERVTLFDVSHMGRFRFDGDSAAEFLDSLVSRRITNLKPNQIRYGLLLNESAGILDDVLVYYLLDEEGSPYHRMVVNAGNRDKILNWIRPRLAEWPQVRFTDETLESTMIAIQGPQAIGLADALCDFPISSLGYYTGKSGRFAGHVAMVSRTGYTGEDGCEIIARSDAATFIWEQLMKAGAEQQIRPAGLGARDTLRLEAAMPLYGHELNESINPYQAGLNFAVHLKDRQFVGREALVRLREDATLPVRVGLKLDGKRVPRENYPVYSGDQLVGNVTSGTFAPTLDCPIAMAYVNTTVASAGTSLNVDIRGKQYPATVVDLPFYQRKT